MSQKKRWSPQVKLKIALLAIKSEETIQGLSQKHGVAPSQIHAWKNQLLEQGAQLFETSNSLKKQKEAVKSERLKTQLFEKIGQLTIERDFLKKISESLHGKIDEH